jgi:protein-S-isoprenylcysteine O-methyltransferase Ste14
MTTGRWRSFVPLACLLVGIGEEIVGHRLLPGTRFLAAPWTLVGLLPLAAGLSLIVWPVVLMLRRGTTLEPAGTPTALVRQGPFRVSRNPIYLGDVLVLLGVGLLAPSAASLAAPVLFFLVVDGLVIPFEEARLAAQFGEEYAAYRREVRRWL